MAAMDPAKAARIRVSELVSRPWFKKYHHRQRNHQLGPTGNAHDKRPRNGVGKKGLQQVARCRERRPQQHHHNGARQAQLQQDIGGQFILPAAQQRLHHAARRNCHAAPEQVERKQPQQRRRKGYICNCQALGVHGAAFLQ